MSQEEHNCKKNLELIVESEQDWSGTVCGDEWPPYIRFYECNQCKKIYYYQSDGYPEDDRFIMRKYDGTLDKKEIQKRVEGKSKYLAERAVWNF